SRFGQLACCRSCQPRVMLVWCLTYPRKALGQASTLLWCPLRSRDPETLHATVFASRKPSKAIALIKRLKALARGTASRLTAVSWVRNATIGDALDPDRHQPLFEQLELAVFGGSLVPAHMEHDFVSLGRLHGLHSCTSRRNSTRRVGVSKTPETGERFRAWDASLPGQIQPAKVLQAGTE